MPTAPKLVSAVAFALVGLAAFAYVAQQPPRTLAGKIAAIVAPLGFVIGWRSLGRDFGKSYGQSAWHGLPASILIAFWALLGFSTYTLLVKSTRQLYRAGAGKGFLDSPKIMLEYGKLAMAKEVFIAPVVGGILGGIVVELSARRWT